MPDEKPVQTTRTPGSDDGDAAEDTRRAGTPNEDERDADEGETDYKALHLANKSTIAKLEDDVRTLTERVTRGPVPAADADRHEDENVSARAQKLQRLQALRGVDPVADLVLELAEENEAFRRQVGDAFTLTRAGDPVRQQKVAEFYDKHRGRFNDIAAAEMAYRSTELADANRALNERIAKLEKNGGGTTEDETKRDVVRTSGRDLPLNGKKIPTMTQGQFNERQRSLRDAGDHDTARSEQQALRRHEIEIKG